MNMSRVAAPALVLMALLTGCTTRPDESQGETPSYYSEMHRPQFHFSPDSMWMNDPNGMVWYEGEYHLFYQHYPHDIVWGPMHWGHAVSRDLVHWEHLPVALCPDPLGYIFSGSAVTDFQNSSGLGEGEKPPMVAIFTHHHDSLAAAGSDLHQYQSIAFSIDRGRSWEKYEDNPVLDNPGIRDFRDPKVFRYEKGQNWIMVLAAQDRVKFYSSVNLIDWEFESDFGENTGAHGGVWECPDLFPLSLEGRQTWVLLVSINPGGPNGGSATQYFTGSFDGHRFIPEDPSPGTRWLDYGKDNYAGVTWADIPGKDGRRIFMGWMSNWQYANQVPTQRWRSAMTVPRELKLFLQEGKSFVASTPVEELATLRSQRTDLSPGKWTGRRRVEIPDSLPPSQYEIDLALRFPGDRSMDNGPAAAFGMVFGNTLGQQLVLQVDPSAGEIRIDRTRSGKDTFSKQFAGVHTAPYLPDPGGVLRLQVLVDRSSLEVFVDEGRVVMTEIFFPDEDYHQISLLSGGGSMELLTGSLYGLRASWQDCL